MQTWQSLEAGGAETLQLREVADPVAGAGEVLLDVAACGINYPDCLIIRDLYQVRPPRPFAPGGEVSGTVAEVGPGVTGLAAGDRVMAKTIWGGLATRIAVPASRCTVMPASMSFAEGASFLFTYGTAYHALRQRACLAAGEMVLVLGAAGGTGIAAIQVAKALGAQVLAAASSPERAELARASGADRTVVYPTGSLSTEAARSLSEAFRAAAGRDDIDVVFDPVGGDYAEPALRTMAWGGRYLVVGFTAGIPRLPLNLPLLKGCSIVGVFNGRFQAIEPDVAEANVRDLVALYAAGQLRPRITRRFRFQDAPGAIALIAARGATGKLVVEIPE